MAVEASLVIPATFNEGTALSVTLTVNISRFPDVDAVFRFKKGGRNVERDWILDFAAIENVLQTGSSRSKRRDIRFEAQGTKIHLFLTGENKEKVEVIFAKSDLQNLRDTVKQQVEKETGKTFEHALKKRR